ncbi:MAG: hypothetical protein IT204_19020 [Fimbriimonadaceae bacterium]|nr:hypothetical protein [Fimbriimonadaceae bacterium]
MALLLTGDRDQALVAMVIGEARLVADQQRGWVGRTAIQKLVYFARRAGVPMGYRFELYHYGPYCDELTRDVKYLLTDGVIADRSGADRYSDYAPGAKLNELLDQHRAHLDANRDIVRGVVQALVPLSPVRLELLATLDYLYRWEKAKGATPDKAAVAQRLQEVKPGRFAAADVDRTYDQMSQAGLLA